jgi:cytochrome c553
MRSIRFGSFGSFVGVLVISLGLPAVATAGGDAAAGKAKSLACQACHVSAAGTGDTPHLAGQRETYLAKQIKAFRTGDRKNPLMGAMAGQLSDADIDNLAAYWSSLPAGSDTTVPNEVAAIKKSKMAFPRDFPKGFVLYGTTNKEDQNAVSKAYVNTIALRAAKANQPLPEGSAIIVVNYAAKLDANKKPIVGKDGSWAVDKVMAYEGMETRPGWGKDIPELLRNANWNYGIFAADKTLRAEVNQAICLACHKPKAETSFVFGLPKIQAKAGAK